MKSEIFISNLKSGGGAITIKTKIDSIKGVTKVIVNEDESKIIVTYDDGDL